ncbi:unnamed protein product, partial [Mesorhabditis belari]|uniref:Large ribosomal subunit protein bL19m n=1 Tax=Mesorhabditis belari TaxID=2138241 RepID=A0AAF3FB14_9BILA
MWNSRLSKHKKLVINCAEAIQKCSSSNSCPSRPPLASRAPSDLQEKMKRLKHLEHFPEIYPDFAQSPVWNRRVALREELERADMLERRMQLDIPEFYVGSILAVTSSDPNLATKENRFVGICIRREREGLQHRFVLRNVIEGIGVEVMYELYNPTIKKIECLKLEKRLDSDLTYLIDALPEYSTFDFNMEGFAHPAGTPIPVNPLKVKMKPYPWATRWELRGCKGIEDAWTQQSAYFKRKFQKTKMNDYLQYDFIANYRTDSILEHELKVEEDMQTFEKSRHEAGLTRRRIFRSAAASKA